MKSLKSLILLVGLTNCASQPMTPTSYDVYILNIKKNKLMGKEESQDLPLEACADTDVSKAQCYVLFKKEYQKLMYELIESRIMAESCEPGL